MLLTRTGDVEREILSLVRKGTLSTEEASTVIRGLEVLSGVVPLDQVEACWVERAKGMLFEAIEERAEVGA